MKFLDVEKNRQCHYSNGRTYVCNAYITGKNDETSILKFPKKFTQYSTKDCKKWFDLCSCLFPHEYLGLEGKFYCVKLNPEDYLESKQLMIRAATALRLVQYEYRTGMTKIPERTIQYMDLGLDFSQALHYSHYLNENICCGHSFRTYDLYKALPLEEVKARDVTYISGYLSSNKKFKKVTEKTLQKPPTKELVESIKNDN